MVIRWGALVLAGLCAAPLAAAQTGPTEVLTGAKAFGDWRSSLPGTQRLIRPSDLPLPYATRSTSNGPRTGAMPASPALQVPAGFGVSLWAQGLDAPRRMTVAPNGDVFVAETAAGTIRVLRPDAAGLRAERPEVFASGLSGPFGMAFYPPGNDPDWLYVATVDAVLRFPYRRGDRVATGPEQPVADLAISEGGHSTRDLVFSEDGTRLFVSVGSQSNDAEGTAPRSEVGLGLKGAAGGDEERRADVLVYDPDGKHGRIYATGLRNCVGLAIPPGGRDPYCSTNERDGLGDNLPPDYVTRVKDGGFYGWPWFYIGSHEDPRHKGERPDLAGQVDVPDVLIQPHSAPLAMTFYDPGPGSAAFPGSFRGSAFVALHGSWNRSSRTGYKVIRVPFENGAATGTYEDFLTGFVNPDGSVWGRPVGVAVARDGALLVSEDEHGTIWRIAPAQRP